MSDFFRSKKIRALIVIFSILLLLNLIQESYAKYTSSASANSSFTIAEWSFNINNQDIITNSNFSSTISPVIDTSSYIKSGVIAPTSTGYFDIVIDSTNVGVAYDQTITISKDQTNTVTDINFTGYKINNGTLQTFNNNSSITISHGLNDSTVNTYRFYIQWFEGTGENMNNADDTLASHEGIAKIDVDVSFVQRAS